MKKCIRCGKDKELNDFYAHPKTRDGHLNKCKDCCKEQADLREKKLRENVEFCEKERLRSIEKYHRLNYKNKQYEQDKLKIYKTGKYKNLPRDLNLPNNENAHHWNYNLIEDVIILDRRLHRFIHRYLILNEMTLVFETIEGNILDSREKHLEYIEKLKIIFK
jgi:hypothetical protein